MTHNDLLNHKGAEPRRQLTPDFTKHTMKSIAEASVHSRTRGMIEALYAVPFSHVRRATVIASISALLLVGGTSFAVLKWQGWTGAANFTDVTILPNGNTRFLVHTRSNGGTKTNDCADTNNQYFEIKAGTDITPSQIADMVAGSCEYTDIGMLFTGIPIGGTWPSGISEDATGYPAAKASTQVNLQYYLIGGTIQKVTATGLAVTLSNFTGDQTQTIPFSPAVKAYDRDQQISVTSLQSGDPVQLLLVARATYGQSMELSISAQGPNLTLPNSSIYGIVKVHHAAFDFAGEGKQFTQLIPRPGSDTRDPNKMVQEYPLH